MKRIYIPFILILSVFMPTKGLAYSLTPEEYCQPKQNSPLSIKEMRPMNDGLTYSAISEDGNAIKVYDYKSGKCINTLFDTNAIKGDLKIDSFNGYVISDNEKKILLWNNTEKIYRNSFKAQYYVYDIMRGTLKKVSEQGAQRGAVISHDGRMVAYTRDNNVYISNLDYDTDKPITQDGKINEIINGVPDWSYEEEFGMNTAIHWNGDDTCLIYMKFNESEVPTYSFDNYKSFCDKDPLDDFYPSQYQYKYPLAGYPNSKVSIHSYNLDTRVTKKMDIPEDIEYIPMFELDGKGKDLVVLTLNRNQNHLRIFKVNIGSTVAKQILEERNDTWLNPNAYHMLDLGSDSFIIGSERSGYCHLYEYDYNGTLIRQLTKGEWNVTSYYGKNVKSGKHFFQCTKLGAINRNIASVDTKGVVTLLNNKTGFESASFSANKDYYVRTYSSAVQPPVYSICNASGNQLVELENNKEYALKYASAPQKEFITIKNSSGEEMNAYIIKPVNFNASEKYPLLMYQYNGPGSQDVLNRWKMEGVYYLASMGYIVAMVDGRGTGNRNFEWSHCVYGKLGEYETEDQLSAIRYLSTLPYVDPDKIGCFGWSYGGYMTLMEMGSGNGLIKAGVAMAPVTDWRYYDSIYTERYMGTPQQNESGYNKASALNKTSSLRGRLLIMSGTSDDNVHFYNTLKYSSKLYYEGKLFDMMALTGFEHSLGMCNARTILFNKIHDFLDNNLKK